MPAGVSWGQYLRFAIASFVSAAAGAEVVHRIYRPLDDFEDLVTRKERELLEERDKALAERRNT